MYPNILVVFITTIIISFINCQDCISARLSSTDILQSVQIYNNEYEVNNDHVSYDISSSAPSNSFDQISDPLRVLFTNSTTSCPSQCITTLYKYTDTFQGNESTILYFDSDQSFYLPSHYVRDNKTAIQCVTTNGYCGATIPIYRYYRITPGGVYHAYSFDQETTIDGFNQEYWPICYGWSIGNATVASRPSCGTLTFDIPLDTLSDLNIYDNNLSGIERDHYFTTHKEGDADLVGYNKTGVLGKILTSSKSTACSCLVKLQQQFDNQTGYFHRLDHKLIAAGTEDNRPYEQYENTGEVLYCAKRLGDCGASLPLWKHFQFYDVDTIYTTTSDQVPMSILYPQTPLCYIWATDYSPNLSNIQTAPPTDLSVVSQSTQPTVAPTLSSLFSTVSSTQSTPTTNSFSSSMSAMTTNTNPTPSTMSSVPSSSFSTMSSSMTSATQTTMTTSGLSSTISTGGTQSTTLPSNIPTVPLSDIGGGGGIALITIAPLVTQSTLTPIGSSSTPSANTVQTSATTVGSVVSTGSVTGTTVTIPVTTTTTVASNVVMDSTPATQSDTTDDDLILIDEETMSPVNGDTVDPSDITMTTSTDNSDTDQPVETTPSASEIFTIIDFWDNNTATAASTPVATGIPTTATSTVSTITSTGTGTTNTVPNNNTTSDGTNTPSTTPIGTTQTPERMITGPLFNPSETIVTVGQVSTSTVSSNTVVGSTNGGGGVMNTVTPSPVEFTIPAANTLTPSTIPTTAGSGSQPISLTTLLSTVSVAPMVSIPATVSTVPTVPSLFTETTVVSTTSTVVPQLSAGSPTQKYSIIGGPWNVDATFSPIVNTIVGSTTPTNETIQPTKRDIPEPQVPTNTTTTPVITSTDKSLVWKAGDWISTTWHSIFGGDGQPGNQTTNGNNTTTTPTTIMNTTIGGLVGSYINDKNDLIGDTKEWVKDKIDDAKQSEIVNNTGNFISNAYNNTKTWGTEQLNSTGQIYNNTKEWVDNKLNSTGEFISNAWDSLGEKVGNKTDNFIDMSKVWISDKLNDTSGVITNTWNDTKQIGKDVKNKTTTFWDNSQLWVGDTLSSTGQFLSNAWNNTKELGSDVKDKGTGIMGDVSTYINGLVNDKNDTSSAAPLSNTISNAAEIMQTIQKNGDNNTTNEAKEMKIEWNGGMINGPIDG